MKLKANNRTSDKVVSRLKRKVRIKKRIKPESGVPRLCVFKSNKHIYAQLVDDLAGSILVSASTQEKTLRTSVESLKGMEAAVVVGKELGKRALAKNLSLVAFDRNGFRYHGRIKALADGAREAGLKF